MATGLESSHLLGLFKKKLGRAPRGGAAKTEVAQIARSGLLDAQYYAAAAGGDFDTDSAARHYCEGGWRHGINPSAVFDTRYYLNANPDVARAGVNPLLHYINHGEAEGRLPNPDFDPKWYAAQHRLDAGGGEALRHYMRSGGAGPAKDKNADAPQSDAFLVHNSGLFDAQYYLRSNPDLASMDEDPFVHFMFNGWREGRDPNPYFSIAFYQRNNSDVLQNEMNPLVHYVRHGDREGRRPSHLFDPEYYRARTGVADTWPTALSHYLAEGRRSFASPRPFFDSNYYLRTYPDVAGLGGDPVLHYFATGYKENLNPGPEFDAVFYRREYIGDGDVNPLVHYDEIGRAAGFQVNESGDGGPVTIASEIFRFANQGKYHEEFDETLTRFAKTRAKAIAFYLPQFHAFPENDKWWGTGFTEWRNTARGVPRFAGHYQPRIPKDLGFYDLLHDGVMKRQIDMAKAAGLHGFCFYYYWFNGKRLLERPVDKFLANRSLNMPFCLMWANENWTRRWDGFESEVLIEQTYREEDDEAFMRDLARHFRDQRYIRVAGRPLFIIYRPGIIPDAKETIARWRSILKRQHGLDPWVFMVRGFGDEDPRDYDLDGAIEFPPHKIAQGLPPINNSVQMLDPQFSGNVISFNQMVERALAVEPPEFPLLRGVTPAWDNEARRQGNGTVYQGSTPQLYQKWLSSCVDFARDNPFHDESLVFINAWNEWAEGAYLEPDVYFGSAYLNATARALFGVNASEQAKILLVGHDAHPHGAQYLLLHIAETMACQFGFQVAILLLGEGRLTDEYRKFGKVFAASQHQPEALQAILKSLRQDGFTRAFCNTIVTGEASIQLQAAGFHWVHAIHELPSLIEELGLQPVAQAIADRADRIVFAARPVADGFVKFTPGIDRTKLLIRPQGAYKEWLPDTQESDAIRQKLGLSPSDKLVINVGYADLRKGVDLFIAVAERVRKLRPDIHFAWLGNVEASVKTWILTGDTAKAPVRFLPHNDNPAPFYEAGDIFFLSSREDPFPTVILEAFTAGLPVIAYEEGGGFVDLVRDYGALAPPRSVDEAAELIIREADRPLEEALRAARARKKLIATQFRFDEYCFDIANWLMPELARVSVIVPNYNYETHLPDRMATIFAQTHPVFETIVLDDASKDKSLQVLDRIRATSGRKFGLVVNETNSGSGYKQWDRGAQHARGDYVWIAEADDLADPAFLRECINLLQSSGAAFVFTDSAQVDETGKRLGASYKFYFDTVAPGAFDKNFVMQGADFVREFLSVKNLILNVSSVVWRKDALLHVLEKTRDMHGSFKVACDWMMYATAALECGPAGFVARSLNTHRRHSASVTHARNPQSHFDEIVFVQDMIARQAPLDARLQEAVDDYRRELRAQFGLPPEARPAETAVPEHAGHPGLEEAATAAVARELAGLMEFEAADEPAAKIEAVETPVQPVIETAAPNGGADQDVVLQDTQAAQPPSASAPEVPGAALSPAEQDAPASATIASGSVAPTVLDEAPPPVALRTFESQGVSYTLFSNGSVEARSGDQIARFGSLEELKQFLASRTSQTPG